VPRKGRSCDHGPADPSSPGDTHLGAVGD